MDIKYTNNVNNQRNRFLKLSLKRSQQRKEEEMKLNRSYDVIVLEDSFDKLKSDVLNTPSSHNNQVFSPILIDDSSDFSSDEELPKVPSKSGNVSFNQSIEDSPPTQANKPNNIGGWSPAQNIICATPRHESIPSTPKDIINESLEQCSVNKIQQSQKEILNDIYGEIWQTIPKLFKSKQNGCFKGDSCIKKLQFDDEESDTENIRNGLETSKNSYLTSSEFKKNCDYNCHSEKKTEFLEQSSVKKILNEIYGESWQTIPKLFKSKPNGCSNGNPFVKKLQFDDEESDTENVRHDLEKSKKMYLTGSDIKKKCEFNFNSEKKARKKLYTEKIPNTPDVQKQRLIKRDVNSTTKKNKVKKELSVTQLVNILQDDVNLLVDKVEKVAITHSEEKVKRLSFIASLADNVPSWKCHPEALQYRDNFKNLREQLTRRLYAELNREVFRNELDADMPIVWDTKLRSTAGTTTNRLIKTAKGDQIRTSNIKLSTKVLDAPARLRDTLVHEMCHAATWIIDGELRAKHGPLWKNWATRALNVYPELREISRCHNMAIHFKYTYKCTKCGYSFHRHSKSVDITKKCCGCCRGKFDILVNKKNKDGVVVSTPVRKGNTNEFALYVKENYGTAKEGRSHAQVMKMLGEQFSAKKKQNIELVL